MAKIGVFDSGVGGITVLKEILKVFPKERIIYYGDNKNAPYGERTVENIRELCLKVGEFLVLNKVEAIVIACNTATAASLETLKNRFPRIPVIGVIEAGAKTAYKTSTNNCIGVIATPATVKMNAYPKSFQLINPDISVVQEGCSKLCPMIESGWENTLENETVVKTYIKRIPAKVDTLVLGCTHYPIIRETISKYFKGKIVDPAKETAVFLKKELFLNTVEINKNNEGTCEFYVSGEIKKFKKVAENFLGEKIEKIYQINL
ncbi:glutamate racemase [uncultured Ilyobacter sp.]|uniref:glutamate racemase n=1 Tax=uncultured Ilyobacter sp. TaxID=544433 RepID=UPI0029F55111|nr:glutamate racemase [uncultured Ilyobacter sp.]